MGHIWSQYLYPIQKTIWMSANFGIKDQYMKATCSMYFLEKT
jgi:hypothetical protein